MVVSATAAVKAAAVLISHQRLLLATDAVAAVNGRCRQRGSQGQRASVRNQV